MWKNLLLLSRAFIHIVLLLCRRVSSLNRRSYCFLEIRELYLSLFSSENMISIDESSKSFISSLISARTSLFYVFLCFSHFITSLLKDISLETRLCTAFDCQVEKSELLVQFSLTIELKSISPNQIGLNLKG